MTEGFTGTIETFAQDVTWSCGLCAANGRQVAGTDRESLELHMNEHIAGALEDPVRLIFDLHLARPIPPGPVLVDVAAYGDQYAVAGLGAGVDGIVALCASPEHAEYIARLWNEDHS